MAPHESFTLPPQPTAGPTKDSPAGTDLFGADPTMPLGDGAFFDGDAFAPSGLQTVTAAWSRTDVPAPDKALRGRSGSQRNSAPAIAVVDHAKAAGRVGIRHGSPRNAQTPVTSWTTVASRTWTRFYLSPAVFIAAFVAALSFTIGLGRMVMSHRPDVVERYERGDIDGVIAQLRDVQRERRLTPLEARVLGNALAKTPGNRRARAEILAVYREAVVGGSIDSDVLHNTIAMLDDDVHHRTAAEVLVLWPTDAPAALDVNARLLAWTTNPSRLMRHGALEVLQERQPTSSGRALAEAGVAVTDVLAWSCAGGITPAGVRALSQLVDRKEVAALKAHVPESLLRMGPASPELNRVSACMEVREFVRLQSGLTAVFSAAPQ